MRQTKSWIVGIACGALCAVCVFMYLQDAGAQVDAARAEALERGRELLAWRKGTSQLVR